MPNPPALAHGGAAPVEHPPAAAPAVPVEQPPVGDANAPPAGNDANAPPAPAAPVAPPPANPDVDIRKDAATTFCLSLLQGDGVDLRRVRPEIDVSKRNKSGLITFVCLRSEYPPTLEERIAQGKRKPEDFKGLAETVITPLKDFLASKNRILKRAFIVFERHAWTDPQTGTFAYHIHLVWESDEPFAWRDVLKHYKETLGMSGWMTLWSAEESKEWGYGKNQGFDKYIEYLTNPSHKKQPWMMDADPTPWYADDDNKWTVDGLLATNARAPGRHSIAKRSGITDEEIYDIMVAENIWNPVDMVMHARKRKKDYGCGVLLNELLKPYKKTCKNIADRMEMVLPTTSNYFFQTTSKTQQLVITLKLFIVQKKQVKIFMQGDRSTLESVMRVMKPILKPSHPITSFYRACIDLANWMGHGAGVLNPDGVVTNPQIVMIGGLSGACKSQFLKALFLEELGMPRVWEFNKPEDIVMVPPGSIRDGDGLIFSELAVTHFKSISELKNFVERATAQYVEVRYTNVFIPTKVTIGVTTNAPSLQKWVQPMIETKEAKAKLMKNPNSIFQIFSQNQSK